MKNNSLKRIPLLFLFAPTALVAICLFAFLDFQHRAGFERQLKINAEQVLIRVGDIAAQPLYHHQFGELKQALWTFAEHTGARIDNIVIYDSNGQFATALNLTESVLNSSLAAFPQQPFIRQGPVYYAYGRIGAAQRAALTLRAPKTPDRAIGFVRVSFSADNVTLTNLTNILIAGLIILIGLTFGMVLWRYRYINFHEQLSHTLDFLFNLNKGFKQDKLPADCNYPQINHLQQQINTLVGFYEKRLTMKQFEVTALELTLSEDKESINGFKAELADRQDNKGQSGSEPQVLLTMMYQVVYQTLQAQLAIIEDTLNNYTNDDLSSQTPLKRQQHTDITIAINQLNQMLGEVKQLADTTAGELSHQVEYIGLTQFVTSISQLVTPFAHAKGLEFIVCQPDHPIDVEINVNQMQKVLIALMQSAVTTTHQGYIKLTVEIAIQTSQSDGSQNEIFCCKVQDSGAGLTPVQYALLLSDEVDCGLSEDHWISQGLRLMVAKKTVEAMGGTFNVKSLRGLGAQYTVALDCKVSHCKGQDLAEYQGCGILLYDPVTESGDVINEKLAQYDMLVTLCRDEKQVSEALDKGNIDCAIFSRPIEAQQQQLFDQSLARVVVRQDLKKCLLLSTSSNSHQSLPKSWKIAEKPFVLTALTDYFNPVNSNSTVTAESPVEAPVSSNANSPADDAIALLNTRKTIEILAVDDNETNLKLLSVILREHPVNLVQALSGREALILSQQQAFDVILMDKEMPNMDGLQTSLNIRQLALNKDTPIVVFTANVTDCERSDLLEQGIEDCMEKPLDARKFYYLMETWCPQRWIAVNTR